MIIIITQVLYPQARKVAWLSQARSSIPAPFLSCAPMSSTCVYTACTLYTCILYTCTPVHCQPVHCTTVHHVEMSSTCAPVARSYSLRGHVPRVPAVPTVSSPVVLAATLHTRSSVRGQYAAMIMREKGV